MIERVRVINHYHFSGHLFWILIILKRHKDAQLAAYSLAAFPTPNEVLVLSTAYNIRPTAYGQQHTTNSLRPKAYGQQPTTNSIRPTAYDQQHTTNSIRPTAYGQQPTTNSLRPTAYGQQHTANSKRPTASSWRDGGPGGLSGLSLRSVCWV